MTSILNLLHYPTIYGFLIAAFLFSAIGLIFYVVRKKNSTKE